MLGQEKDTLLRKLTDVENEGKEASRELDKLRKTCRKLKHVRPLNYDIFANFEDEN